MFGLQEAMVRVLRKLNPEQYALTEWEPAFAWLPTHTIGKRTVWLRSIYRRSWRHIESARDVEVQYATTLEAVSEKFG